MNPPVRRVVVVAIVFGVLAAAVAALVVPTRSEGGSAAAKAPAITVLPPVHRKLDAGMVQLAAEPGSVHIERRLTDPLGGPPFALRVFRARRLGLAASHPSLDHARLLGHVLCAQLGRLYNGRFGWIDARNRFRPVAANYIDAPIACGDHWVDSRSAPQLRMTTLISDPDQPAATARQAVAWGFAGGLAKHVALEGVADKTPQISANGAFLVVADPATRGDEMRARIEYRGRPATYTSFAPAVGVRPRSVGPSTPLPVAGTGTIEARAPDPGGGIAWGILGFRTDKSGFCVSQPGRVVDDRVGTVNFVLGTFEDVWDWGRVCGASSSGMPPGWPVSIGSEFGGGLTPQSLDPTADPDQGRTELRTLPGHTILYGAALPTVRQLTIESPRDVRTLVPSPNARSFLVVYDGTFPAGQFKLTATFNDGSKKTVSQPASFG